MSPTLKKKKKVLDVCQILPYFPPLYMCFFRSIFKTQKMQGLLPLKTQAENYTMSTFYFWKKNAVLICILNDLKCIISHCTKEKPKYLNSEDAQSSAFAEICFKRASCIKCPSLYFYYTEFSTINY